MTELYVSVALSWFLGGFVKGIAGFGAAIVAMPLVLPRLPALVSVPACTLTVLAMNAVMLWTYRRFTHPRTLLPLLVGAVPGAMVGNMALRGVVSEAVLRGGIGVLLVAYACWGLFQGCPHRRAAPGTGLGMVTGFLSTLFGAAFGINGPPLVVYTTLWDWTQDEIKAALGMFFVATGATIGGIQALAGIQTMDSLKIFLLTTPGVLVGDQLGTWLARRLQDKTYRKVLYVALLLMGADMLRKAL